MRVSHMIGSLSTRVFETRTATGSEPFSLLTCLHTTAFALPSIFSPLEMLGIKIWETPLSRHVKCPLPVDVRVSKTCVLKLPFKLIFLEPLRSVILFQQIWAFGKEMGFVAPRRSQHNASIFYFGLGDLSAQNIAFWVENYL